MVTSFFNTKTPKNGVSNQNCCTSSFTQKGTCEGFLAVFCQNFLHSLIFAAIFLPLSRIFRHFHWTLCNQKQYGIPQNDLNVVSIVGKGVKHHIFTAPWQGGQAFDIYNVLTFKNNRHLMFGGTEFFWFLFHVEIRVFLAIYSKNMTDFQSKFLITLRITGVGWSPRGLSNSSDVQPMHNPL